MYSDKIVLNGFGSDAGKIWQRTNEKMNLENLIPSVKHVRGSVMLWSSMVAGIGSLVFFDWTIDRFKYLEILQSNLESRGSKLGLGKSWVFQQENNPKCTAKIFRE